MKKFMQKFSFKKYSKEARQQRRETRILMNRTVKQRFKRWLQRLTVKKVVVGTLLYAWLFVMLVIVFTPLLWMISASFTDARNLSSVPIIPRPSEWSLANYIELFTYRSRTGQRYSDYLQAFFLSLQLAVLNMILVVIISSLTGFAFSRYRFTGKKKVLLGMMTLQMFPSFMGMIALFMLFSWLGLTGNPYAVVLVYVAGAIPYNTFIVRGFMRNIPKSLDEAAMIDGATNLQIMRKIIIPLALPIMGFIAVTAFMGPWMDYILQRILLQTGGRDTVAVWLFRYMDPFSHNYNPIRFMTGALFITVPIMLVQLYMQKFVVYGLTAGAEKG